MTIFDAGGDKGAVILRRKTGGMVIHRTQQFIGPPTPSPMCKRRRPQRLRLLGLASAVYGQLTGRGRNGQRYFTTSSIPSGTALRPGQGTFTIRTTAVSTWPGTSGVGVRGSGSASGIHVGGAARSVNSFARQFFLPQVGGYFVDGGGPLGSLGGGRPWAVQHHDGPVPQAVRRPGTPRGDGPDRQGGRRAADRRGRETAQEHGRPAGGTIHEPTSLYGLASGGLGLMGERGPEQITPLRAGPQPGQEVHVHLDLRNAIFLGGARQVANELAPALHPRWPPANDATASRPQQVR